MATDFEIHDDDGRPVDPLTWRQEAGPAAPEVPPPAPEAPKKRSHKKKAAADPHREAQKAARRLEDLPPPKPYGQAAAAPKLHVSTAGAGRYRVSLRCPTPLQFSTLEVEAAHEDDARAKFCAANGISGSSHEWQIQKIA